MAESFVTRWRRMIGATPIGDQPETVGHTIVHTDEGGVTHTQRLGREHVVEGSDRVIEVPAGTRIIIRHVAS